MKVKSRAGVSRTAAVSALVVIVVIAGIAAYVTLGPANRSSTSNASSTSGVSNASSSASVSPPQVTVVPASPLISPGETQNYTAVELQPSVSGPTGNVNLRALAPTGLSFVLNQTSVSLSGGTQLIPAMMKAAPALLTGNYTVTLEISGPFPAMNETFAVGVVSELVVLQDVAFHPQNITVPKGTRVTWINLDSQIGCCDPGNHDVSFLSGANATSPILMRYDSWSYSFGFDGVVEYYCTIHPYMKGQVTITG